MKKRQVFFYSVILATALSLTFVPCVSSESNAPGVTDTTVKIGGPMLITGPIAKLGTAAADGLAIYWKWVNDQGGVHGRKIECLLEDDGYNPTRAVAAAKKLMYRDNIFAFLTTSGTPQTLQLMPILEKEKIPALSGIIQSFPGMMKDMPMLFTFGMPYGEQMILAIDYAVKDLNLKNPTFGIVYQDDAYGKENIRGIELAVNKYGLKIVGKEAYKRGAVDFSSQALNLKRANPDIVTLLAQALLEAQPDPAPSRRLTFPTPLANGAFQFRYPLRTRRCWRSPSERVPHSAGASCAPPPVEHLHSSPVWKRFPNRKPPFCLQ